VLAALGGPDSPLGQNAQPSNIPLELTNLGDVAELPTLLSVFLALLALAALSFVLVVSSRSRHHECAVLRAIGLGPGASRSIVYWQATVIAVVGLVVGLPLGIVVGRWVWHEVAARVPLVYIAPFTLIVVGLAIPTTLVLANAVATWPARRLSSLRPAEALRAE
jgi:ABC-type lipoprotein release transport system permease subunit